MLATHLAAYCANSGIPVMLGDVDRQQSTQTWLRLRKGKQLPGRLNILGWVIDPKMVLRSPAGIQHVVLDTPGGLRGLDLARVVMFADAILMPVCNSVFDRESAAECYTELMTLPRISSGRCKLAAVGMRLDGRTRADEVLKEWATGLKLPFIGVLRETQLYVRCVEQGLTLFDLPAAQVQPDMAQWAPILQWLEPLLRRVPRSAPPVGRPAPLSNRNGNPSTDHRNPAQSPTPLDGRANGLGPQTPPAWIEPGGHATVMARMGYFINTLWVRRLLQRYL